MSSPPSANIDPQLYNKTPKIKSKGKSKNSDEEFRLTPNFTGWTPLVSKTNEFPVNANGSTNNNPNNGIGNGTTLTPSSKFLNNILVNFNNQQYTNSDIDYSNGLNLTPFLNHNLNLNLLNSNSINHIINHQLSSNSNSNSTTNLNNLGNNLNNVANNNNNANNVGNTSGVNSNLSGISYTPFHDKSLLLTDFFIDSPIRSSKDLSTITPSKFLTNDKSKKPSIFQDPKSSQKLNIKSFTTDKPNNDETDDETDDENKLPSKKRKFNFQTPSKILNDITHHQNKLKRTPVKDNNTVFVTPDKPLHNSSPSTVILSSDTKGNNIIVPNSPTPNKDFKPVMGTFSDGNNNHSSNGKPSLTNASASASTGSSNNPSTKNTGSTVKNKLMATPTNLPIKTSIINTNHGTRFKPSNRAQMQAGMNKFQIVLNDSNGVKRGRKSRKNYNANNKLDANNNMNKNNLNKRQKKDKKSMPANVPIPTPEPAVGTVAIPGPVPVPVPMPVAVTMSDVGNNTGKSPNSMISNNFSNLTDQTSFLSTPNKNFNFFEKSPNSSLLNQLMMNNYMLPPKSANAVNANTNTNGNILNNNINAHDSGPNGQINSQMLMMMMMSTPNNQNVYQFSPSMNKVSNLEINDLKNHHNDSTTNKNEDDNDNGKNEGNVSLSAFSYFNGKSK